MSSVTFSPGTIIGRIYRVVKPLAQGGMGAVYVAEDLAAGRPCAVKVMHARLMDDPKNRERFAQEAAVGEHIGTDHVVEVYGRGIDDATGMPFIAMELLQGETLQGRIWRDGRPNVPPLEETLSVLDQLGAVLEAAHARGLVHRDLKPENIFLTPRPRADAPFTLKLLDFGVARFVDPSRPVLNATAAIGTPLWMAPEQHTGAEISPAADVFAVGLIAFQLLTGRFYWLAANQKELNIPMLLQELLFDPLPSAAQRASALGCVHRIPSTFDAWFTRCVAREPQARFTTAVAMRAGLAAALSGPMLPRDAPRASVAPSIPAPAQPYDGAPTQMLVADAPTAIYSPAAHEAPTVVHASVRAASASSELRPGRSKGLLVVAALSVTAGLGLAVALLRPWIAPDASPRRFPGRVSHGAPTPSIVPSPLPLPTSLPRLHPTVWLEGQGRTWQGSLAGQAIDGAGFELTLNRVRGDVHGDVRWMFADGGELRERATGSWDVEKAELWLQLGRDRTRRIHARGLPAGDLSGEFHPGGGERSVTLNATLKTPLVGAAPP